MSHEEVGDRLPLFQSPLVDHADTGYHPAASEKKQVQSEALTVKSDPDFQDNDQTLHDHPQFQRHTEATNAELFYDLFFVANLTVFTQVKEVNDHETLAQYVGFFCILWFTWYQVGLYDVRFSMDSVFERIAKACQFGVMIGFAVTSPSFDVGIKANEEEGDGPSLSSFQALTIILMASRFVLVAQYLQSLWFTRSYKQTILPLALIAGTYFVAAFIYLGLYWTFTEVGDDETNHTYLVWYVVAIIETLVATAVSSYWRVISFKGTHLVERMSLLTLIILGEGVIGLAERCQNIVKSGVFTFSSSTIGNIISAILILYFIYMLYFDWISEEHFGTIRQQIWAFLHFPLHLALVLAVEGVGQSIAWNAATIEGNSLFNELNAYNFTDADQYIQPQWANVSAEAWEKTASSINETATNVLSWTISNTKEIGETIKGFQNLETAYSGTELIADGANNYTTAINAANWIYDTLFLAVYELAGFVPPESESNSTSDAEIDFDSDETFEELQNESTKISDVFLLTFVYFFVAIGLVIILCTILAALSKKEKRWVHWIRLATSGLVGLALCLMAAIATSDGPYTNFTSSPWMLPTVMLALFVVVVLNSIRLPGHGRKLPELVRMRTRNPQA